VFTGQKTDEHSVGCLSGVNMNEDQKKKHHPIRICPVCKGTGLDKAYHHRFTTGGHDDRSCPRCHGECYIEDESNIQNPEKDDDASKE
jgi:uncharacterized paraquat-inducible protein A